MASSTYNDWGTSEQSSTSGQQMVVNGVSYQNATLDTVISQVEWLGSIINDLVINVIVFLIPKSFC